MLVVLSAQCMMLSQSKLTLKKGPYQTHASEYAKVQNTIQFNLCMSMFKHPPYKIVTNQKEARNI